MKSQIKNYVENLYPDYRVKIDENLEFSNADKYTVTLNQLVRFSLIFYTNSKIWMGSLHLFGGSLNRDKDEYTYWYPISSECECHPSFSDVIDVLMGRIRDRDTPSKAKRSLAVLEDLLDQEGSSGQ